MKFGFKLKRSSQNWLSIPYYLSLSPLHSLSRVGCPSENNPKRLRAVFRSPLYQTHLNSNVLEFRFPLVGYSNRYSYGPNHSKTEPSKIWTKCRPFCSNFQWFCLKWNTNRKPNAIGNRTEGYQLEFQTCLVFQSSPYLKFWIFSSFEKCS